MNVAVSCDHAGFSYKAPIMQLIKELGHTVIEMGASSTEPVDYPDITEPVARAIQSGQADRAVIICGSGVGITFTANKFKGVRACICHDSYSAHQGVEHDDLNVLCIGAKVVGIEVARELVTSFLAAKFSTLERYHRRIEKVELIERRMFK
ncbi:ribose 5-phosphate isomerase B [Leptolinea tardivitalis]|uniref:Ribose 5-phosphate isomerase n=1 Tax=Leptolinea tardivitalis TaxID=229920 RepID=A0A0P6WYW7_9CHLR|nr:ribose 5-phosphate isomerase B [Leptolinea tardivitalis]KPL71897.1 ribose 5-phosphate isomerase [Leptolinea tardivitalis]GAP20306.1 ribose 5-phosphate isomerase B [Leptolinea tardivitalis]